jgi:hypothetical protein
VIDARFAAGLALVLGAAGALAWPWVGRFPGGHAGLLAGLGFSYASLVLGLAAIRWGLARNPRRLVTALLGAMTVRVLALLAFALVLGLATRAHLAVGLLTVVATHVVIGMAEIVYLKRTDAFS